MKVRTSQEFSQQPQALPMPKYWELKLNLGLLALLGIIIVGTSIYVWYFSTRPKIEPLQLSGRIEGYETDVGAKVTGRINFVTVREGDRVRKGQVIAQLDDAEIQAQLRGATARLAAARQQELQAKLQINVIESQLQEAQLNLQQAQGDAQGRIFQAQANVAAAEAQLGKARAELNQAQAELKLANLNRDRLAGLLSSGVITQQQFDQTQTALETAKATYNSREAAANAAHMQVNALQGGLVQAQTTGLNPSIRKAQLNASKKQLVVAHSQLVAAKAEVTNAQAARQEILAQINYLRVESPIDGVVTARSVEPGAVVVSGKTLLTLLNPNTVYLRGYIPGGDIGKVRVGQQANVFLDSAPEQALSARVAAIDSQASFTPENIYFREERVKQVVGVKLSIDHPAGFAKPGMPADAEVFTVQERQLDR